MNSKMVLSFITKFSLAKVFKLFINFNLLYSTFFNFFSLFILIFGITSNPFFRRVLSYMNKFFFSIYFWSHRKVFNYFNFVNVSILYLFLNFNLFLQRIFQNFIFCILPLILGKIIKVLLTNNNNSNNKILKCRKKSICHSRIKQLKIISVVFKLIIDNQSIKWCTSLN